VNVARCIADATHTPTELPAGLAAMRTTVPSGATTTAISTDSGDCEAARHAASVGRTRSMPAAAEARSSRAGSAASRSRSSRAPVSRIPASSASSPSRVQAAMMSSRVSSASSPKR